MNKYVTASALVITHALVWFIHGWYDDSLKLAIESVRSSAALSAAEEIAKIRIENKTITAKTIERIKTETVYRDCVADETMMQLTNKALTGK
jgi:hypothetical protein